MKLSDKDFKYYKDWIKESESIHKKEMLDKNKPDSVINMYEGFLDDGNSEVYENYMHIAVMTSIPSLFYQFPRPVVTPKGRGTPYSANIQEEILKFYINDDWKIENQLAIIDAYLPYGYGVMKVAYNSRSKKINMPLMTGTQTGQKTNESVEADNYIEFEQPIIQRVSPKDTFLDHDNPFHNPQRITFKHKRTIQQIVDSGLYDLSSNFISYFKGRSEDLRKNKVDLYEHFCIIGEGVYKLCFVEEWDEPLFWGKTRYKGLPVSLLRFGKTSDKLYAVSSGKLAYNAQKELQYLNDLWKQHVDHIKRQHLIDGSGLKEGAMKTLEANIIDGIIETTRPPATVYQQIASVPMGKDVYANIENVRNYLKLLLNTSGGRGGENETDFAETEKQQAMGDTMRMSGMQDNIRDFSRKQLRLTAQNLYELGNPELAIKITNKDVRDPVTGDLLVGKQVQFGGENGLNFQSEIEGDISNDYIHDVDITSAARQDYAIVRAQLDKAIQTAVAVRPLFLEKGKDVDIPLMIEDYFNSFDTVPNPQKYIVEMSPEQIAERDMQKQFAMQSQAVRLKAEEAKAQGEINNGLISANEQAPA